MGLKDKIRGTSTSIKEQLEYMKKDSKYLKKIIQSKKVVLFKTDATAILIRKKGNEEDFFKEYDKLTGEGYESTQAFSLAIDNPHMALSLVSENNRNIITLVSMQNS